MSITIQNFEHHLIPNPGVEFDSLPVSNTAVSFDPFNSATQVVLISVEDANVRVRFDGTAPDASTGFLLYAGQKDYWSKEQAEAAQFIRAGAADAAIGIQEWKYAETSALGSSQPGQYRSITFDSIYNDVLHLRELSPTLVTLSTADAALISRQIEQELRTAYEMDFWPGLQMLESRDVTDDGAGAYIPMEAAGLLPMGEIAAVYDRDPEEHEGAARQVSYRISHRGIELRDNVAESAMWVRYRLRPPQLTRSAYSGVTEYEVDDYFYWSTTGDCYLCIADAPAGTSPASLTYFQRQRIPWVFGKYAMYSVHAKWLHTEGRHTDGRMIQSLADSELDRVRDVRFEQQGQHYKCEVRVF